MHRPLTENDLRSPGLTRLRHFRLFPEIESTNRWLLERAAELADGTVACAEHQTAGRGRLGRTWEAPRGAAILLSVLLHELPLSTLGLTAALLGAVAAVEALDLATTVRCGLRWPNDLYVRGRKLGGVLGQTTRAGDRLAVVIGVGLNVLQQPGHFPPALADKATSLEIESTGAIDRPAVAAALVRRLDAWLAAPAAGRSAELLRAWRQRCEDPGQRAVLLRDGRRFSGIVEEVSATGDLLVRLDDGSLEPFSAANSTRSC